jgi:hypothetical protein
MTTSVILLKSYCLNLKRPLLFGLFWKRFDIKYKTFAYETITVTNLPYWLIIKMKPTITKYGSKKGNQWESFYKFNNTEIVTDKNGSKRDDSIQNYFDIIVTKENDTLTVKSLWKQYFHKKYWCKIEFYLDRAIYRPGQTVYYKGMLSKKKMKLVSSQMFWWKLSLKTTIIKNIQNFEVTTNSFGSFFWEFQLPQNGLTSNFTFQAENRTAVKRWTSILGYGEFENSRTRFRVENTNAPNLKLFFEPIKRKSNQSKYSSRRCQIIFGSEYIWFKVKYKISYMVYSVYDNFYREEGSTGGGRQPQMPLASSILILLPMLTNVF